MKQYFTFKKILGVILALLLFPTIVWLIDDPSINFWGGFIVDGLLIVAVLIIWTILWLFGITNE